jgi:two-component system, NtrC family, response regulator AtoC
MNPSRGSSPKRTEPERAHIMVVDDDERAAEIFHDKLEHSGYEVTTFGSAEEALGQLKRIQPQVIITDLRMPGMSGLDLLARVREHMPHTEVIVVTGHEDMSTAVAAMKAGAFDYIVKPVDLKQVDDLVARCLGEQELNRRLEEEEETQERRPVRADTVVGRDPRMIDIYKMIGVLAKNRATVMIRGETGTGKEMVARAIHENSAHASDPFIAVNCTALTDTLLESELFGHQKGSFTGAVNSRKGYFELAGSGTIFLDEIGDTSPDFQTKLLRVLQERKFYPVGGEQHRTTEARVIAATHQNIEDLVDDGKFREDLYFRLKVVEIRVPPLRERREDVALLADALLGRIRKETNQTVRHIAPDAMAMLLAYDWPGNVRELENALTRAAILARGAAIGPEHLTLGVDYAGRGTRTHAVDHSSDAASANGSGQGGAALSESELDLEHVISKHVRHVLERTAGNKSETARLLGISRSRLQRYVDKFKL